VTTQVARATLRHRRQFRKDGSWTVQTKRTRKRSWSDVNANIRTTTEVGSGRRTGNQSRHGRGDPRIKWWAHRRNDL